MPPIIILAAGAFAAGAIVHRLIKEVRRINSELDRVKTGRAIDPVLMCQPSHEGRSCETRARPVLPSRWWARRDLTKAAVVDPW
jgi:hypothetical protein